MNKIEELNNDIREITNAKKLAELKRIKQFVACELLNNDRKFQSELKAYTYNVVLENFYTFPRYDTGIVTKNDIISYFEPLGIIFNPEKKEHPWTATFDPKMFQSYEPQTKSVTYKTWFGLSSKTIKVGLTAKDRLKMAILDLYPTYSQDQLDNIFRQKAKPSTFNNGSYLYVSPEDPWYFAMLNYPKEFGYFQLRLEPNSKNFIVEIN